MPSSSSARAPPASTALLRWRSAVTCSICLLAVFLSPFPLHRALAQTCNTELLWQFCQCTQRFHWRSIHCCAIWTLQTTLLVIWARIWGAPGFNIRVTVTALPAHPHSACCSQCHAAFQPTVPELFLPSLSPSSKCPSVSFLILALLLLALHKCESLGEYSCDGRPDLTLTCSPGGKGPGLGLPPSRSWYDWKQKLRDKDRRQEKVEGKPPCQTGLG